MMFNKLVDTALAYSLWVFVILKLVHAGDVTNWDWSTVLIPLWIIIVKSTIEYISKYGNDEPQTPKE